MNSEDISSIFEKLNIDKNSVSQDSINNFLGMLQNSNSNTSNVDNSSTNDSFNASGIDMETMLKMKSIIDKMNTKDNPSSNLLLSLKPYLKESRKGKLDQYIQLMNMSKMMDVFPFFGGDKKKNE